MLSSVREFDSLPRSLVSATFCPTFGSDLVSSSNPDAGPRSELQANPTKTITMINVFSDQILCVCLNALNADHFSIPTLSARRCSINREVSPQAPQTDSPVDNAIANCR